MRAAYEVASSAFDIVNVRLGKCENAMGLGECPRFESQALRLSPRKSVAAMVGDCVVFGEKIIREMMPRSSCCCLIECGWCAMGGRRTNDLDFRAPRSCKHFL
jgi:hypothetical protein